MYRTFDLLLSFKTLFPFPMQIKFNLNKNLELNESHFFLSRLHPLFPHKSLKKSFFCSSDGYKLIVNF